MSTQVAGVLRDPLQRPIINAVIEIRPISASMVLLPGAGITAMTNLAGEYNFILEPAAYAISVRTDGRNVWQGAITITSTTPPSSLPELINQASMDGELPSNIREYFNSIQTAVKEDADRAQESAESVGDQLQQAQQAAASAQQSASDADDDRVASQDAYQKTKVISDKFQNLDAAVTQTQQNAQQTQSDASKTEADRVAADAAAQRAEDAADSANTVNERNIRVPSNETINPLPAANSRANSVASFAADGSSSVTSLSAFAMLDGNGKVPLSRIPAAAITEVFPVNSQAAMLALSAQAGDVAIINNTSNPSQNGSFILMADPASNLSNWKTITSDVLVQLAMGNGSSKIGYQLAGQPQRTVQQKLGDTVSVKDFGAKGDGSTDDTASIQAAVNYLSPRGGVVYLPAGAYKITSAITVLNMPVIFRGDGMMSTEILQFGESSNGIEFTSNTTSNAPSTNGLLVNSLELRDLSINKAAGTAGIAVKARWGIMTSNSTQMCMYNFRVYSKNDGGLGWKKLVSLTNCNGLRVHNSQLLGIVLFTDPTGTLPYKTDAGLEMINEDNSLGLISFFVDGLTIMRSNVGIDVQGWHEGWAILNGEIVQNAYGIRISGHPVKQNPVFFMANTHIDARFKNIDATNVFKMKLVNCDLFKNGGNVPIDGNNVFLTGCVFASFVGCSFSSNDLNVANSGIVTDQNSYYGIVDGCHFTGHSGSSFNLYSQGWNVGNNVFYKNNVAIYQNGSNNEFGKNTFRENSFNTILGSGVVNQITPRQFRTRYTYNLGASANEMTVTVPVPAGVFMAPPETAIILVVSGGLFANSIYDAGSSSATSLVFKIRDFQNQVLGAGNYIFEVNAESYAM